MELSETYAERVSARLAGIAAGDPLDGAAEPLKTAPATKDGRRLGQSTGKPRVRLRNRAK